MDSIPLALAAQIAARFWAKVDRSAGPDACWIWMACRHRFGHGKFGLAGNVVLAHRVAYALCVGPIGSGLVVRHLCHHPWCVNPRHLTLGTVADNARDMAESGRGRNRRGQPQGLIWRRPHPSTAERLWARVEKTEGCWLWTGSHNGHGYGRISDREHGRRPVYVHRLSYELAHGPIPAGLDVLHRCDEPRCVNPDHLFLGSARDNSRDMFAKGRGRPGHICGVAHGGAKATPAIVSAIRCAYQRGDKLKDISAEHGLSLSVIHAIATGRTWKHVGGALPCLRRRASGPRKLTWDQVRTIRSLLTAAPLTAAAMRPIAQQYAVSVGTIRLIALGRIWKEDAQLQSHPSPDRAPPSPTPPVLGERAVSAQPPVIMERAVD